MTSQRHLVIKEFCWLTMDVQMLYVSIYNGPKLL